MEGEDVVGYSQYFPILCCRFRWVTAVHVSVGIFVERIQIGICLAILRVSSKHCCLSEASPELPRTVIVFRIEYHNKDRVVRRAGQREQSTGILDSSVSEVKVEIGCWRGVEDASHTSDDCWSIFEHINYTGQNEL